MSKLVVRPPCLPRTYQSLYRHFDGILQAGTKRRGRPSALQSNRGAKDTSSPEEFHMPTTSSTMNNSSPETGSVVVAPQPLSLPAKECDLSGQITRLPLDIPDWATSIVYKTCRVTGATIAPSHIFAGLGVALKTFSQPPLTLIDHRLPIEQAPIFPLIMAIHLCVSLRLSGVHVSGEAFDDMARRTLQAAKEFEFGDEDWQDAQLKMIHAWIAGFQKQRFLEIEWYHNIPKGGSVNHKQDQASIGKGPKLNINAFRYDGNGRSGRHTLIPGLGTMVCLFHPHSAIVSPWYRCKTRSISSAKRREPSISLGSIVS